MSQEGISNVDHKSLIVQCSLTSLLDGLGFVSHLRQVMVRGNLQENVRKLLSLSEPINFTDSLKRALTPVRSGRLNVVSLSELKHSEDFCVELQSICDCVCVCLHVTPHRPMELLL